MVLQVFFSHLKVNLLRTPFSARRRICKLTFHPTYLRVMVASSPGLLMLLSIYMQDQERNTLLLLCIVNRRGKAWDEARIYVTYN